MRNLVEALPVATVLIDDDDRVVGWNRAASALYGWQSHETVTMTMAALVVDADWPQWEQVRATAHDDGLWRGNFRVVRRDGVALVSSFIAVPVVTDETATMAWIATDVTDQALADQDRGAVLTTERLMREELETALGLVEGLLDSLPLGLATFDADLRCTRTNSTFDRILGGENDPVGRPVDDLGLPPAAVGHLRRVIATGRAVLGRTVEVYLTDDLRHVTAYAFPIFADGRLSGVGTAWVDDTAAQRVERERQILERRAEDAHDRLAVLAAASSILATATDVDLLIDRLARTLAPSAAEWCMIELVGPGGRVDHVAVAHRDRDLARLLRDSVLGRTATADDDSAIGTVYQGARAVSVGPEAAPLVLHGHRAQAETAGLYRKFGFTSALVVPIRGGGTTIGVLCLADSTRSRLTDDDLDLAIEVAQRTALAVGRAMTYLAEHALAEQLQRALLPARLPELPQLDIEVRYRAAAQAATVGGDWYDAFPVDQAKVCLCIGDVFGHDTRAAVGMGRVRTLVNAFAMEEASAASDGWPDLDAVLRRTEHCIADDSDAWGSCLLAVLDVRSGELRIVNAGHPPAVLIREQAATFLDAEPGGVLGLNSPDQRVTAAWSLRAGDRVLLYTDGLVERRAEPLDVGLSRLLGASGIDAVGSSSFCDDVLHAMTTAHEPEDDIALFSALLHAGPGVS